MSGKDHFSKLPYDAFEHVVSLLLAFDLARLSMSSRHNHNYVSVFANRVINRLPAFIQTGLNETSVLIRLRTAHFYMKSFRLINLDKPILHTATLRRLIERKECDNFVPFRSHHKQLTLFFRSDTIPAGRLEEIDLKYLAANGQLDKIKAALCEQPSLRVSQRTLDWACISSNIRLVRYLLDLPPERTLTKLKLTEYGLYHAAACSTPEMVTFIVDNGVLIDQQALDDAARNNTEVFVALYRHSTKPDTVTIQESTMQSALLGNNVRLLTLIDNIATPHNERLKKVRYARAYFLASGTLLSGEDYNQQIKNLKAPTETIYLLIGRGLLPLIVFLVQTKDIKIGYEFVYQAAYRGQPEELEYFLKAGELTINKRTLRRAFQSGQPDMARYALFSHYNTKGIKADLSAIKYAIRSMQVEALDYACSLYQPSIAELQGLLNNLKKDFLTETSIRPYLEARINRIREVQNLKAR